MPTPDAAVGLHPDVLAELSDQVISPSYDRGALRPAILHIGVGGFHRAHLATYADELCRSGHSRWAIVGAGVLAGDVVMAEVLGRQEGLYTLLVRSAETTDVQIIGSLVEYLHGSPDPSAIVERIADPTIQVISLTITEGGYPVDDRTGEYQPDSPNAGSASAFGVIAAGLDARRNAGGGPLTIVSCDNILTNGRVARAATLGEASQRENAETLTAWIAESVRFPNSMVDRITPSTADSDREWLRKNHGIDDGWPVVTEPFRQWVIEDDFAGERLPLEELDVIVTDDVEPYEFMKLRLLNAGHSCLAYLAALLGIELVDQAMAVPAIDRFLRRFLHEEAKPVLPDVAGIDIDEYIDSLIERFRNPAIGDQIARLCLDGSAKFPKFLMPTVQAQVASGGSVALSALALAGWSRYLSGVDESGEIIAVSADPHLVDAQHHAKLAVEDPVKFLAFDTVFDDTTARSEAFRTAFVAAFESLRDRGVVATIDLLLGDNDEQHAST